MKRLAIVTTHPIQYNDPWFRLLAAEATIELRVFYTWSQTQSGAKYDPGFGRVIEWDIPLLQGYDAVFVPNTSTDPGTHHFKGVVNPTLIKAISDWKPDCILVIGWSFKSHLQCLRYFSKKIPVLFRGDSTLLDETAGLKQVARRIFLKWVYRHIDYALYVGTNNKAYFFKHGLTEKQLFFAPHAIDNDRFGSGAPEKEAAALKWRRELNIRDDEFVVLFAGKLEAKKNPFFLAELAARLTKKDIRFIIAGNGVLEAELKQRTAGDTRFIFLDFQNQHLMPVVYRLGDVFVLPSNGPGETWGLAINEAMACARPVLASRKSGCAIDLVHEYKNGIIADPANVQRSADFILELSGDSERLRVMGHYSQQLIRQFSFRQIVDSIKLIIERN